MQMAPARCSDLPVRGRIAIRRMLASRSWPIALGLSSAILLGHVVGGGFQLDDHFQRARLLGEDSIGLFVFYDGDPEATRAMMDEGLLPWWTAEGLRHAPLRYLSVLTMQLDFALWPERPAWMHLHSLLWLVLLVTSVAWLYRRLLGASVVAALAGLLFAVDDSLATPTAYLANRNALIAVAFGVLSLVAHDLWRREGRARWAWASAGGLGLGLAGGEMALGAAGYLAAYAACLERGGLVERIRSLVPAVLVLACWAGVYALGPFGAEGTDLYLDPLGQPLAFASAFLVRAPVMIMSLWTSVPADLAGVALDTSARGRVLAASIGVAALVGAALLPRLRRDPVARFFALGALLSLVPVASTLPQARTLTFAAVGSIALLARGVMDLLSWAARSAPGPKWTGRCLAGAILTVHLVVSPLLGWSYVRFWERVSDRVDHAIASAPTDPAIADQDLIVVNPPDFAWMVAAIPAVREVEGRPAPRRLRALFTGTTGSRIERTDARTLVVTLEEGLFPTLMSRYHRSRDDALRVGDRIRVDGMAVEVLRLDAEGSPDRLRFRFARPLDDPSLRWVRFVDGAFADWSVPAIGGQVGLEGVPGIFESG